MHVRFKVNNLIAEVDENYQSFPLCEIKLQITYEHSKTADSHWKDVLWIISLLCVVLCSQGHNGACIQKREAKGSCAVRGNDSAKDRWVWYNFSAVLISEAKANIISDMSLICPVLPADCSFTRKTWLFWTWRVENVWSLTKQVFFLTWSVIYMAEGRVWYALIWQ